MRYVVDLTVSQVQGKFCTMLWLVFDGTTHLLVYGVSTTCKVSYETIRIRVRTSDVIGRLAAVFRPAFT